MRPEQDEVKAWLQKARNDLLSARILMEHDPPVRDTACFHCQQVESEEEPHDKNGA